VTDFNLLPLLPEIFLAVVAMGLLMVGVMRGNEATSVITGTGIVGLFMAMIVATGLDHDKTVTVLNGMFVLDGFGASAKLLIMFGLMASLALSMHYLKDESIARFEYPVLVLFAGLGMLLMVSAHNFLSLYLALELQSLSLYVLAAFHRDTVKSAEAGVKYFTLGALSSGMILFGISLFYGLSGTLDFGALTSVLGTAVATGGAAQTGVIVALVFVLAGLAFKISAVPFHMWTPDVYQGAPTSVTALFAIVPKLAAMVLLVRLAYGPFAALQPQWAQVVYVMALGSMIVGAFAAIVQDDIKRLMAYSSIGHMGYALIGLSAGTQAGAGALMLYMLIYMVMAAGAFAAILCLRHKGQGLYRMADLAGLSRTAPVLAYGLAILMFSMAGIPPLAGFFGKWAVFQAAIDSQMYGLAIGGVLASVVAAYYYLRVVKVMFFDDPADDQMEYLIAWPNAVVLGLSLLFVVGFVAKPSFITAFALAAVGPLF
jgi:NADH-quinone oxidoreductase subunit N